MPCDQIRRITVAVVPLTDTTFDVGKVDRALLAQALIALNVPAKSCTYDGAVLTITARGGTPLTIDNIRQAYSQQVVAKTAKRYGWALKSEAVTVQGETRYVYNKR